MKLYNYILVILLAGFLHFCVQGQRLESAQYLESFTANEITLIVGLSVNYGVDLYKIRYYTPDIEGNDHVASGLLCVPQNPNLNFPLAVFQHGTVGSRDDVPSNLQGGYVLPMIFASFGYVVCAPDFVGLGDSPGVHPYVHADTEASAAVDMLYAAREYDDQSDNYNLNDQVFVTGYSQGGHAAMAAHRTLQMEYSQDFTVTASAPMSGPYSISEKMIDFTLGDDEYATVAYLAWVFISYKAVYPQLLADFELEDIFLPAYVDDIKLFEEEMITLWDLNDRITATLIANHGVVLPKLMLQPGIETSIKNDPNHPFSIALQRNDTYDWAPDAPTRLYYCMGDDQVTFENAILAEMVMQANGAPDVQASQRDGFSGLSDHGECVFPASYSAILFFNSFQDITSSVDDLYDDPDISINYNQRDLYISLPFGKNPDEFRAVMYDMTGRVHFGEQLTDQLNYYNIQNLSSGMYVMVVQNADAVVKTRKIIRF